MKLYNEGTSYSSNPLPRVNGNYTGEVLSLDENYKRYNNRIYSQDGDNDAWRQYGLITLQE